jgi:hypothetical protein
MKLTWPYMQPLLAIVTYKGWGFVLATSCLLYWLIQREVRHFQKAQAVIRRSDSPMR